MKSQIGQISAWSGRLLAALSFVMASACLARADFVKTGNTYQTVGTKVVIVNSDKGSAKRGIFILSGTETPVQLFDLPSVKIAGTKSIFIEMGRQGSQFAEILTSGGRRYKIRGSFSLLVGETRITLDTMSNASPYLSVVDTDNQNPALLGIVGTSVAVNASGVKAVALLEAQLPENKGTAIEEYVLREDGTIAVGNAGIVGDWIGIETQNNSRCQSPAAISLNEPASNKLLAILAAPGAQNDSEIRSLINSKASAISYDDLIILRQSKESIVAFEYATGEFLVIKPWSAPGDPDHQRTLCITRIVKPEEE